MDKLEIGDWILMKYGFDFHEWYVYEISGEKIRLGKKSWCVRSSSWFDISEVRSRSHYLGKGKFRWWWLILPWRDVVCPFSKYKLSQ
jgi:hypothetical protein